MFGSRSAVALAWGALVAGLGANAFLQARAVRWWLGDALRVTPATLPVPPRAPTAPTEARVRARIRPEALSSAARLPSVEQACAGISLRIVSETMVEGGSLATLVDERGNGWLVTLGDRVGQLRVRSFGATARGPFVGFATEQGACRVELFSQPVVAAAAAPPPSSAPQSTGWSRTPSDRRTLLGRARLVPRPDGLELRGIEAGSLLASLGLAEGDRLQRVSGVDARRPEALLLAMSRLRNGGDLDLELRRGGKTVPLRYSLR